MTTLNSSVARFVKRNLGYLFAQKLLTFPEPELFIGAGALSKLGPFLVNKGLKTVFVATDDFLAQTEMFKKFILELEELNLKVVVFGKITPDPAAVLAVEGANLYFDTGCQVFVGFGGGSSIDCMKLMNLIVYELNNGVSKEVISKPNYCKSFMGSVGVKPTFKPQPMVAIPTTAGTGSEVTIASVISFPETKKKYFAGDPKLMPEYAVLDAELLKSLPKGMTAATGVDALTHAIEAYLSYWATDETKDLSGRAVSRIFASLRTCYSTPGDLEAREQMLLASYEAGLSFTKANIGYVHAIAHNLGGVFHTPHGVANAMVLPYILDFYLASGHVTTIQRMGYLFTKTSMYSPAHRDLNDTELAKLLITEVKKLVADLHIPNHVKNMGHDAVPMIAERAIREGHGCSFTTEEFGFLSTMLELGYPSPVTLTVEKCQDILSQLVDPNAPITSKL